MAKSTFNTTDLTQNAQNANHHTERGRTMLENSLREYGAARSIVLDKNGVIIAGNLTAEYAAECGITKVRVVRTTGDELVAVMRTDLDITFDVRAKELALADNRTAQVGIDFDPAVLQALEAEGVNLDSFFSSDELQNLFLPSDTDLETSETPVPALAHTPITQPGDLYEISLPNSVHRLLCGDSTIAENVLRLMDGKKAHCLHTDPPYNVGYADFNLTTRGITAKDWTGEYCEKWEDDLDDKDYAALVQAFLRNAKEVMTREAHYYVWFPMVYYPLFVEALKANDIKYDALPILWRKKNPPISWARHHRAYESCFFAGFGAPTMNTNVGALWYGENNETNFWEIDSDHNNSYVHPTQKPVALPARALRNSTRQGDNVLELFAGSGSTMLASAQMFRNSFALELSPYFCDCIVKRFIKYSSDNNLPLLLQRNGTTISHDDFGA